VVHRSSSSSWLLDPEDPAAAAVDRAADSLPSQIIDCFYPSNRNADGAARRLQTFIAALLLHTVLLHRSCGASSKLISR
jgi:hypothetical protein